jgi:hypothetical protein
LIRAGANPAERRRIAGSYARTKIQRMPRSFALPERPSTPENGPFEVARGPHRVAKEKGMRMIESGDRPLEPVFLAGGDIMFRDVRGLHRGTPNRTDTPRPMAVIGYSRKWLHRPEVRSGSRGLFGRCYPGKASHAAFQRVVESLDTPSEEIYQAFAY